MTQWRNDARVEVHAPFGTGTPVHCSKDGAYLEIPHPSSLIILYSPKRCIAGSGQPKSSLTRGIVAKKGGPPAPPDTCETPAKHLRNTCQTPAEHLPKTCGKVNPPPPRGAPRRSVLRPPVPLTAGRRARPRVSTSILTWAVRRIARLVGIRRRAAAGGLFRCKADATGASPKEGFIMG